MSAKVLSFFWELAALDVDRRVKAAASLIAALKIAQAEFEGSTGGALCPDLSYAVRRLVRGLASPRDGARQGFGAALIELLGAFDEVTPEEVLEQVSEPSTQPGHAGTWDAGSARSRQSRASSGVCSSAPSSRCLYRSSDGRHPAAVGLCQGI